MAKKRIAAALTAITLIAALLPPSTRAAQVRDGYEDLDGNAWYAQGVRYCIVHELMNGYGYKKHPTFGPDKLMTRAQFITVLWRIAGEPKTGLMMQYNDIPEDAWYTEAVRWALATDVMDGYDLVTFGPDDPLLREQLVTILWRFTRHENGGTADFTEEECAIYLDREMISDYAEEAMSWACGMGILTGIKDRAGGQWIAPASRVTRAAVATILMRFCLDMGYLP